MKIFIAIGSRANYSSIKSFIRACHEDPGIDLIISCFSSAVLEKYGNVSHLIEKEGYPVKYKLSNLLDGNSTFNMAKSTGLALIDISTVIALENPDFCLTVGDRFETMATAIASAYSNVRLIHTMGGELSGSIDESIRHAITKLAHIHFAASEDAYNRILKLGESPQFTFNVGCPRLDVVSEIMNEDIREDEIQLLNELGVGQEIDIDNPFAVISLHPVTTKEEEIDISILIESCLEYDLQVICLWQNADFGTEKIPKSIRTLRESGELSKSSIRFYKNLPVAIYIKLMSKCSMLIGNSSSGIREGAFIGTPCINLGNRQSNRERGPNVIDIPNLEKAHLKSAIQQHLDQQKYPSSTIYGDGNTAERMIKVLKSAKPPLQKTFIDS